jgi:hypothetical protein
VDYQTRIRFARLILMSVLAPTSELLFFVWAKKSNQKKAHPTAAYFLRSKAFAGGWQKGLPAPLPTRRIHAATLTGYSQQKLWCSARQTGK